MSIECGERERDVRGGHADNCSRAEKCKICKTVVSSSNVSVELAATGLERRCRCGATKRWEDE